MVGLCCGILSTLGCPVLQHGLAGSSTVPDIEAHEAVQELQSLGVDVGPCGAASLAAFRSVARYDEAASALHIDKGAIVVLLSTKGGREYAIQTS